ncbi:MAG TPA: glycine cleavage T C-terminal barrel domain-containing protein [Planctomycetota bacterium]|nr:glycine cleavage T C-terminal barrel domain-containing protein [Planctomycetota bacterium]|tara:strand:+ start:44837 stop:45898 length:1062 start_codon:yes stop_codon:yes gene_type:complete
MKTGLTEWFENQGADFVETDGVQLPVRVSGAGKEYAAARESLALFDGGDRGWMEMSGPDTADFLQRMLSSDVRELSAGGGQWSALLNGKGKWVSDFLLFGLEGRGVDVIGIDLPASRLAPVRQVFEMAHFGEELSWSSPPSNRLLVLGPQAETTVAGLGLPLPKKESPSCVSTPELTILRRPDRGESCLELIGNRESVLEQAERLVAEGGVPSGLAALDILRVEALVPRWGTDFGEESTLPETNEWHRASFTKGCYTGQEVVAKIHTYGEAPRQLCHLSFHSGTTPLHGAEIQDEEGESVGQVTSWIWSPLQDRPIGLGLLRRKAAHEGNRLWAVSEEIREPLKLSLPPKAQI